MDPNTSELVATLAEIVTLLRSDGEAHWASQIDGCRKLLLASDFHGIEKLLAAYGGMGSFNDLVVGHSENDGRGTPEAQARNEELNRLRSRAYQLAQGVRRRQLAVEELRATELERLRSLVDSDMEAARRIHADDFQLINPLGGAMSKEQYLGLIASGDIAYLEWVPDEVEVKLYGDAAVLRYPARLRIAVKGIPDAPSGRFWHTDLYEKRDGRWQVVWSQATQIQS